MKRFYEEVTIARTEQGWIVALDGRPLKTQGGQPQVVPTEALAEQLAEEWLGQGEVIEPASFRHRDMADYALDVVSGDRSEVVQKLLGYAETDTLCFRADPEEPLYRRQQEVWDPIVSAVEAREGVQLHRISGILHRPQTAETRVKLRARLEALDPYTLTALEQTTSLSASLCIGLESLREGADAEALWDAANLEEDWQADLWGRDEEAEERRAKRKSDFLAAVEFARAV